MVLGGGGGGWWPVSDGDMMGGQRRSQDAEKLEQSEAVSLVMKAHLIACPRACTASVSPGGALHDPRPEQSFGQTRKLQSDPEKLGWHLHTPACMLSA